MVEKAFIDEVLDIKHRWVHNTSFGRITDTFLAKASTLLRGNGLFA